MKQLLHHKRKIVLIALLSVVISIITLAHKRAEACPPNTNQNNGATLCETYGPRTFRGYPFGITYETPRYVEAMKQEGITVKTNYLPVVTNTLFYALWLGIVWVLYKTFKNEQKHKNNKIDLK